MKKSVLIGIGAAAIMSGNQARRRQRQAALEGKSDGDEQNNQPPPPMPTQSNEVYHDDAIALAQSISQYHYGAKMPGYMT